MRTRITNCTLIPGVDGEAHIPFVPNAEVQVDGNLIAYAGERGNAPDFNAEQEIDAAGHLCMPGLVNLHTHTPMTFLRSAGAELTLDDWLHKVIFKLEAQWQPELVRTATDLGCMEMLRFGTTSFCDMYMFTDSIVQSVRDNGMRALIGYGLVDSDGSCRDLKIGVKLAKEWNRACSDRIRISIAPHAEYTSTPILIKSAAKAAIDLDLPFHIHVSETRAEHEACIRRRGLTPMQYLKSLGALGAKVIAAHCVWLSGEDIELAAKHHVTIAHNPVSNLKLASGIAPVARMLKRGCSVALGTDGVASNDNLNLWEELKLMPLLQKGTTLDPDRGFARAGVGRRHERGREGDGVFQSWAAEGGLHRGFDFTGTPHAAHDAQSISRIEPDLRAAGQRRDPHDGGRQGAVPRRRVFNHRQRSRAACRQ